MLDSLGMWEVLVLLVAALFILGPERLPSAMSWVGRSIRKAREFATGARDQLRDEIGPEFDNLREPIEDLRKLRGFDPKRAVTQHLFEGDEDPLGFNETGNGNGSRSNSGRSTGSSRANGNGGGATKATPPEPLAPGEKPPVDPDAT